MNSFKIFRHEFKYFINYFDYVSLKSRLKKILKADEFSGINNDYHVRSLYFDDLQNSALFEKQSGILQRRKFRIRIYNYKEDVIKLEKKSRVGLFINKETVRLKLKEYHMIRDGKYAFLKDSTKSLFKEFYFELAANRIKPDVVVDYVREAYKSSINNIRITFDKNLRTGLLKTDLFDHTLPTVDVIERPVHILEIKYDNFLPDHLKKILQITSNTRFAISKFVICKKYTKFNNWEDN
jgi:hypothetical protein